MNDTVRLIIALLAFPGLLSALVLTLLISTIAGTSAPGGGLTRGIAATLAGRGSMLLLFGALAPLFAVALLPWAGSPLLQKPSNLWTLWAVLEASYLAALLPSLASLSAVSGRSAIREAQLAAAGRLMLWATIVVAWWAGAWSMPTLLAHVLTLAGALIALPVAAGWGAFTPDTSLSPAGAETDFSRVIAQLAQWGRVIRAAVLVLVVAVLMVPQVPHVHWGINIGVTVVASVLLALIGRTLNTTSVRRTLPDALNWCFTRAIPVTALAVVALMIGRRWL